MIDKEKFRKEVEKLKSNLIHGACSSQVAMETRCKEEAYNEVLAILDSLQEEPVSIWHDAREKSNKPESVVIINPNDYSGDVIPNCIGVNEGNLWACTSDLLNIENPCNFGKNWKELEEPVSDELEEAAKHYLYSNILYDDVYVGNPTDKDCIEMFKAGVKWQKQKDSIVREDLEEAARRYAALQAGMKDAMTSEFYEEYPYSPNDVNAFKAGTKWQKQQDSIPSKDLAELIDTLSKRYPEVSFAKLSRIAVRVSRWQRNQDVKNKLPKVISRTDLDEFAYQCAYDMSNDWAIDNPTWHDVEDACKLGANWQKEQDQSTIELAEDHAMLAGMEKMKEEMTAKAIDGKVLANGMGNPILHLWDKGRYLIDKKVKVIVIKED